MHQRRTEFKSESAQVLDLGRSLASRKEQIIQEMTELHQGKYDYSHLDIHSYNQHIELKCQEHGAFSLLLLTHRKGGGCPYCSGQLRTNPQWQAAFVAQHGKKYTYLFPEQHIKSKDKIDICCTTHGKFTLRAADHQRGRGCPECSKQSKKALSKLAKSWEKIKAELNELHQQKYDYSGIKFEKFDQVLHLTCKEHGEFQICLISHRKGGGCPFCKGKAKTNEDWLKDFKLIHGDVYHYRFLGENTKSRDKVEITCVEGHTFQQTVNNHKKGQGCPECAKEIRRITARQTFEARWNAKAAVKPKRVCYTVVV